MIPRRLGFRYEGLIKEEARVAGREPVDLMVWALDSTESLR